MPSRKQTTIVIKLGANRRFKLKSHDRRERTSRICHIKFPSFLNLLHTVVKLQTGNHEWLAQNILSEAKTGLIKEAFLKASGYFSHRQMCNFL
jgi:hypothetical protein